MLFLHYLKVAWRNLLKYKTQSAISILGLAIGLTFFTLSSFWIRYEMTYDHFHKEANTIYTVGLLRDDNLQLGSSTPYPLANFLEETFPEIEAAGRYNYAWGSDIAIDGEPVEIAILGVDSGFVRIFDLQLVSGSMDFLLYENQSAVISDTKALQLLGTLDVIGKKITYGSHTMTVVGVFKGWTNHTNILFDVLIAGDRNDSENAWYSSYHQTLLKTNAKTDPEAFIKKLKTHAFQKEFMKYAGIDVCPLTKARYANPHISQRAPIQLNHIWLFALSGAMIIVCSLFNYLTLFVNRIRIRRKELALRTVSGSTGTDLLGLLMTEWLVTFTAALVFGIIFNELMLPYFLDLSRITIEKTVLYQEVFTYAFIVLVLFLLCCVGVINYFRRHSLRQSFHGGGEAPGKNYFRKASIVVQLIISIGFAFCTIIMIKQLYHLKHTDIGLDYKDKASVSFYGGSESEREEVIHHLRQLTGIKELLANYVSLIPKNGSAYYGTGEWDEKPEDAANISVEMIRTSEEYARFWKFRLVKGRYLEDSDPTGSVMLNETAARTFGWDDPIGKTFQAGGTQTVVGIIQDFHCFSPTRLPEPMSFSMNDNSWGDILIRFQPEEWKECKTQIDNLFKNKFPNLTYRLEKAEDAYNAFFTSEDALLKILSFTAVICILISLFGIFSLVTLVCQERRKEIAIRKVNGAQSGTILIMIFREYLFLLVISVVVAFPVGYLIMKRWIEHYTKQTSIDGWIYVAILIGMACIISLSIISRVLRAANQNPAEVVKSE